MSAPLTYEPSKVKVTFGGVEIQGFTEGTFVEVERDVELEDVVGVDYAKSPSGSVTLTLIQESPDKGIFEIIESVNRRITEACAISNGDWRCEESCVRYWIVNTNRFLKKERRRARMARKKRRGWA